MEVDPDPLDTLGINNIRETNVCKYDSDITLVLMRNFKDTNVNIM